VVAGRRWPGGDRGKERKLLKRTHSNTLENWENKLNKRKRQRMFLKGGDWCSLAQ